MNISTAQAHTLFILGALLFASTASANYVLVLNNVNLRPDPSSANQEIRLVLKGERLKLISQEPGSKYLKVKTEVDRLTGFAYAGSGRLQIIPSYDRSEWKHWFDEDSDGQDTRNEVLIAESEIEVTFKTAAKKKVKSGRWDCPFTGETFTDPGDVDIDHMVPLENAHISGGWAWSAEEKQDYANSLENQHHLVAVDDSTNQSKGSKGPERWQPPNEDIFCEYGTHWEAIKLEWELDMSPAEVEAVAEMKESCE